MITQTFSIGFPDSSTTYPSRRQSPVSGVAVGLGSGGTLTGIEAEIVTNVDGRGAGVPGGVARGWNGVGSGVGVGETATGADGCGEAAPCPRTAKATMARSTIP